MRTYRAEIENAAMAAARDWFRRQTADLMTRMHAYYRPNVIGFEIAPDKPGPEWVLVTPEHVRRDWEVEQVAAWLAELGRRLPILPLEDAEVEMEATKLHDGRWAVRPAGQLGTCGPAPVPWTVVYVTAGSAQEALAKAGQRPVQARPELAPGPEGPPNLDCMTDEELLRFHAERRRALRPIMMARRIFPDRPAGFVAATVSMTNYAMNLITARRLRRDGEVGRAEVYERICERIYEELPEFAQW